MGALFASLMASRLGRALAYTVGGIALAAVAYLGFIAWLAAHDASVAREARSGYVLLVEKTAAEAKAAEAQRQLEAAQQSLLAFRTRLAADAQADAEREKERENEILAYEIRLSQANRRCSLDADDLSTIMRRN